MSLVKSKQRVADHGEVFTPAWMVEAMLDLVKGETERIDSRFLETACGDGAIVATPSRQLAAEFFDGFERWGILPTVSAKLADDRSAGFGRRKIVPTLSAQFAA